MIKKNTFIFVFFFDAPNRKQRAERRIAAFPNRRHSRHARLFSITSTYIAVLWLLLLLFITIIIYLFFLFPTFGERIVRASFAWRPNGDQVPRRMTCVRDSKPPQPFCCNCTSNFYSFFFFLTIGVFFFVATNK